MKTDDFRFSGNERIKSKKLISRIFTDGIFHFSDLISVKFIVEKDSEQLFHQAAFSVPKKKFKLAVHRNRIKRLMKEAYRLNKHILYEDPTGRTYLKMIFIFRSNYIPDYRSVNSNIIELLEKLKSQLS